MKHTLSDFKISIDTIPEEVYNMSLRFTGKQKYKIEQNFLSVLDYICILYHLRFIQKMESSEIASTLNFHSESIHYNFYNLRWNYNKDYKKNLELYQDDKRKLQLLFLHAKKNKFNLEENHEKKILSIIEHLPNLRASTFKNIGFTSSDEYVRTIYYLQNICDLSTQQLSIIFDSTLSAMHSRLNRIGLNTEHSKAIMKKVRNNRQDYETSSRNAKNSRLNNQRNHGSVGTKNENRVRALLSNYLYEYFSSTQYDIIVGVNNTGILGAKEVDIPVVIHHLETNKLIKIAVEYNGEIYYHDDNKKRQLANNKGWEYISIIEKKNSKLSNSPTRLNIKIHEVCKAILQIVQGSK